MKTVFLGNARWSVPSLEALAASGHRPEVVLTRSARPAGRGSTLRRTPVADVADALGLELKEIDTVKSGLGFEALLNSSPQVLVVVAYGEILPADVLAVPSVAPVNVHFSLLPRLRGAAPVQRAILEGEEVTGVTTIRMDEGLDTGPILMQREEPILPDDDAGVLGERLAKLGGRVLVETLEGLESRTLVERPQDESRATYARKLGPEDRVIDWAEGAERVVRRVRALSPDPGAETRFRGKVLKVYRASWRNVFLPLGHEPGRIFRIGGDRRPAVLTVGTGVVFLDEVAPEGRKRMSGADLARGYRPAEGEILG